MSAEQSDLLPCADIIKNDDDATLRSVFFDDIYFNDADGVAECAHVFLGGNKLQDRFGTLSGNFTIAELGFGTGLNFLSTWSAWHQQTEGRTAHLHYFSFEGFPLSSAHFAEMLRAIAERWPSLQAYAERLMACYPPHSPGLHVLAIDPQVTLYLWFGDVEAGLEECCFCADAWYLDGFSPAKNPSMWTARVFHHIALHSRIGTSIATFTAAGHVRQKMADAGFAWEKKPGFGRKKHMVTATLKETPKQPAALPWFHIDKAPCLHKQSVAIIGAGIAGASAAFHLQKAGHAVTLFDAHPASGASGNPAGLLIPRMDADQTPAAHFYRQSWLYALHLIEALEQASGLAILDKKGALRLPPNEKESRRNQAILKLRALPPSHLTKAHHPSASGPCLDYQKGGVLCPANFISALLQGLTILHEEVEEIKAAEDAWFLETKNGQQKFDKVVIAGGVDTSRFVPAETLGLTASIGQMETLVSAPPIAKALISGHYIITWADQTYAGASYEPFEKKSDLRWKEERKTRTMEALQRLFPGGPSLQVDPERGRVSLRCVTPDQNPIAGPLPRWNTYERAYADLKTGLRKTYPYPEYHKGLYVITGLGSRGFSTAPLLGAYLAALISGTPLPITQSQGHMLHPGRHVIRNIKRHAATNTAESKP